MAHVVAVIAESDVGGSVDQAARALDRGADLVEFRIDFLNAFAVEDARALARKFGPRAIATLRSPAEGGQGSPLHDRRQDVLETLCAAGFAYVDVELDAEGDDLDALRRLAASHGTRLIASHHAAKFADVDDARHKVLEACRRADVGKVAVPLPDLDAALELVDLARELASEERRFCLIGLGPIGAITRVLADETSQEFQYAPAAQSVMSGQLALETSTRIRGRPKVVTGILGHPLGHSLSPAIHEAAFAALDLPGVYLPFDLVANELAVLFARARDMRLRGVNVSIPYKEAALDLVDELDTVAEDVGAVNAVRFDDGQTRGYNTDVHGFEETQRAHGIRVEGRRALVLGAGGAARAVAYALLRGGADVAVLNRTRARAEGLSRQFAERPVVMDERDVASSTFDLVVNATPLGMSGFAARSPAPPSVLRNAKAAVDLVYHPPNTPFLQDARAQGVVAIGGLEMLVHQAAKTFELFTGTPAPLAAMFHAATEGIA